MSSANKTPKLKKNEAEGKTTLPIEFKYFTKDRIAEAINHLKLFNSNVVIPALVFACNGVNTHTFTNTNKAKGTDSFLNNFFSGSLIGLPSFKYGNALRPVFSELKATVRKKGNADDLALHQDTKLWANAYSSRGYREWLNKGYAEKQGVADYKLEATFTGMLETALLGFHFEELLVWLYAFSGVPATIETWSGLFSDFKANFCANGSIPAEYAKVFNVSNDVPWPPSFLANRLENIEYQEFLFPSSFLESIPDEKWIDISESIKLFIADEYKDMDKESEAIARDAIAGLIATKRLFILGDPGTGKSTFSKAISNAFSTVLGDDRVFVIQDEITDTTNQQTLIGFCTVNGSWINGSLTSPQQDDRQLLYKDIKNKDTRSQINLLLLEEANRKDVEQFLAKFQSSLDSKDIDPKSNDHKIRLDGVGDRYLSPLTFVVMTGNSPKDDEGRLVQSRPFKRRPALVVMPNPFSIFLQNGSANDFIAKISEFWKDFAGKRSNSSESVIAIIDNFLNNKNSGLQMQALFDIWNIFAKFKIGVSYGILEKYLCVIAKSVLLGQLPEKSFDHALTIAIGPLISVAQGSRDDNLKVDILVNLASHKEFFPEFYQFIENMAGDPDMFGQTTPFL